MKFEEEFMVPEGWSQKLSQPGIVIRCLPGLDEVVWEGNDRCQLRFKTHLGPLRLIFEGMLAIISKTPEHWTAEVTLKEKGAMGGSIFGHFDVHTVGPGRVRLVSEIHMEGRLAEMGVPLMKKRVEEMAREFQKSFVKMISS
jgi:carbon monoxide dehydrogenase subunit G